MDLTQIYQIKSLFQVEIVGLGKGSNYIQPVLLVGKGNGSVHEEEINSAMSTGNSLSI